MLLCEVAIGKSRDLLQSDYYADKLPAGCISTKGVGVNVPDPAGYKEMPNGTIVPCGKQVPCNVPGAALLYNEFIVYDIAQIKMKYLVKLKFNY
jgi:hypothetical protein